MKRILEHKAAAGLVGLMLWAVLPEPQALANEPTPMPSHVAVMDVDHEASVGVSGYVPALENVRYVRGHLEVPLAHGPRGVEALAVDDPLVTRVALVGGTHPRLIIRLRGPRSAIMELSTTARVESGTDGFRVLIPRRVAAMDLGIPPAEALENAEAEVVAAEVENAPPAVAAPEPEPVAAAPAETPPETKTSKEDAPVEPAVAAPTPTAEPSDEEEEQTALPLLPEPAEDKANSAGEPTQVGGLLAPEPEPMSPMGWGLAGLAVLGLGGFVFARRRRQPHEIPSIRVIANHAVAGRSRVVMLDAAGRRFLVGVTDKGLTLLDRWKEDVVEDPEELIGDEGDPAWLRKQWSRTVPEMPAGMNSPTLSPDDSTPGASLDDERDPALAGILRLRRQREASAGRAY